MSITPSEVVLAYKSTWISLALCARGIVVASAWASTVLTRDNEFPADSVPLNLVELTAEAEVGATIVKQDGTSPATSDSKSKDCGRVAALQNVVKETVEERFEYPRLLAEQSLLRFTWYVVAGESPLITYSLYVLIVIAWFW